MRPLAVVLALLILSFALSVRPAQAADTLTYPSFTVGPVRAAGVASSVQTDTSPCTDPNALCLPSDTLKSIFNNTTGNCTWTYTINWGGTAPPPSRRSAVSARSPAIR